MQCLQSYTFGMFVHRQKLKRTTLLCAFCIGILSGIGCAKFVGNGITAGWIFIGLCITVVTLRKKNLVTAVALLLFGVSVGFWRGGQFLIQIAPYTYLDSHTVTVQVTADSSAVYAKASQLEFDASHVEVIAPYQVNVPGKMVMSGFGENSVLRGDKVTVTGKLYKRRGSKQAGISFGTIKVTQRSASVIEALRRNFLAGLATALPEPHDQFAAGLLIGQQSGLPSNVVTILRTVGLSHVIAVSGYNLTILAEVARKRLGKKSKYRSTVTSIALVLLFVALAGSSASIARAAFVSILSLLAAHYGRSVKPVLLILIAACYTALTNPFNVWGDIGWYLSFLAFFGVLVVAPALQNRLYKHKKEPGSIASLLFETTSAQIMTIPIILFIFGEVSVVSLIANLIVVPFVPIAMLLSLLAGLAGMIAPAIAGVIAYPARILLGFMLQVSSLLSRIPHALEQAKISAAVMVAMYILIVSLVLVMRRKSPKYVKVVPE